MRTILHSGQKTYKESYKNQRTKNAAIAQSDKSRENNFTYKISASSKPQKQANDLGIMKIRVVWIKKENADQITANVPALGVRCQ